ncbi:Aste57867_21373 [Aphanomyces stellatus]|uniref:non-specific serine/threonine protein kinase n=1 Tax=Aphanomyces stellatus TaxID=120398 RepID=A0A485LJE9_9STRA|nr:hypothetical protein As57867_021304 [Aphanomyces stellatus]VFT98045.1 Aste57867_21373 [Aphanomyces stellatus]
MMDDDDEFDFGASRTTSSLRTHDEIWADVKRKCRELSIAKKKLRAAALTSFRDMITSPKHKQVLHLSCTWSYVLTTLFAIVEEDSRESMQNKKKKHKDRVLEHEALFHNVFDEAHTNTPPSSKCAVLDRDKGGIETLKRIIHFCSEVIGNLGVEGAPIEASCFRLLDKVLKFEGYCTITDDAYLKKILHRSMLVVQGRESNNVLICSKVVLDLLQNMRSDMHAQLNGYMQFFHEWFQDNRTEKESQNTLSTGKQFTLKATNSSVARNLLSCMVVLMNGYSPHVAPQLSEYAQEVVAYVHQNLWDDVAVLALEPVEFLMYYCRLAFNSQTPPTSRQCRELKQLYSTCVLDDRVLTNIVRQSANMQVSNSKTISSLNEKACSWLSMVADVIFYHDQWSDINVSSAKRVRHMKGFEFILSHLELDAQSHVSTSMASQFSSTQWSKESSLPRLRWLLLLQALLARHGPWYASEQSKSLISLRDLLITSLVNHKLEIECIEQTLQCLLMLALRLQDKASHGWLPLWQGLLSEFLFRNLTKTDTGEIVLQLLSAMIALDYIPVAVLEKDLSSVVDLPSFLQPSVMSSLLLYLIQTKVDADVCNSWTLEDITIYHMKTLKLIVQLPDGVGHAAPMLAAALKSVLSDGPSSLDCTPFLMPALFKGFVMSDLQDEYKLSMSKNDQDIFEFPEGAQVSRIGLWVLKHVNGLKHNQERRITCPPYLKKKVCFEPSIFLDERLFKVLYSCPKTQSLPKGIQLVEHELESIAGSAIQMTDSASSDLVSVSLEVLMNLGVVLATLLYFQGLECGSLITQVLSPFWPRATKWLSSNEIVSSLRKLLYILQLLARSVSREGVNNDSFPPACRATVQSFKTLAEDHALKENTSLIPQIEEDDVDSSLLSCNASTKSLSKLWCLRIFFLIQSQRDSGDLLRQVEENQFLAATMCLELIPALCENPDNVGVIIYILQQTIVSHPLETCRSFRYLCTDMAKRNYNPPSDVTGVENVLNVFLDRRKNPRRLREEILLAYEQLFVLDADRFGGFSDYILRHFSDVDIHVQITSFEGLQSAFDKFPDGAFFIFEDVDKTLRKIKASIVQRSLANYISAASSDVLMGRILSNFCNMYDEAPELIRSCIVCLGGLYSFPSTIKLLEDQLWPTLCSYIGLTEEFHVEKNLFDFPLQLFDPEQPLLVQSTLIPSLIPLAMLLDISNDSLNCVGSFSAVDPSIWAPSIQVAVAWACQRNVSVPLTKDMTLSILMIVLNLNSYAPDTFALSWDTFEPIVYHPIFLVDIVLAIHSWMGQHRLKSSIPVPLQFLCDCIHALADDVSNSPISQRIVLHVLMDHLHHMEVASLMKTVCEHWMREPDTFGHNLNHLISGFVLRYPNLPVAVQETIESIAQSMSRVQKLGKFLTTLNPFPSHISPGLNQLQRSYNVDMPVLQTLAIKLTRPPLNTSPLTAEALESLQEVIATNADNQHIPTIVHGLLANAYQIALRDSNSDQQVQVATCLGLMGAIFPQDLLSHDVVRLQSLYLHLFSRPSLSSLSQLKDPWIELLGKILECLVRLLFVSDGALVHTAHTTIEYLLTMEIVQVAVGQTKSFPVGLKAFLQSLPPTHKPPTPKTGGLTHWNPSSHSNFSDWICHVTCSLLRLSQDPVLIACVDVCALQESVAVFLLPLALYSVLMAAPETLSSFEQLIHHEANLPEHHGQVLVQAINYVRHLQKSKSEHATWTLPYLQVAHLALRCKMPYSALQYIELHLELAHGGIQQSNEPGQQIGDILLQAYKGINAFDAIDGVKQDGDMLSDQLSIYNLEKKYSNCLPLYDVVARQSQNIFEKGMAKTLHTLGYTQLLEAYLSKHEPVEVSKYQYNMAWRQSQWNLKIPSTTTKFDGLLYGCFKSMTLNDGNQFRDLVTIAKKMILMNQNLSFTGLEMTKTIHKSMLQLETLAKLESVWKIKEFQSQPSYLGSSVPVVDDHRHDLIQKWQKRHVDYEGDFDIYCNILYVEETCLKILGWTSHLPTWYLKLAKAARKAKRTAIAFSALHEFGLTAVENAEEVPFLLEKAKLYFSLDETSRAVTIAKTVHEKLTAQKKEGLQLAKVNSIIGKWLASIKAERSEVIHKKYLAAATTMFDTTNDNSPFNKKAGKAYRTLANYMYDNYNQAKARVESNEWKRGKKVAATQEEELRLFEAMSKSKGTKKQHIEVLRRQVDYDKNERNIVEASVDRFLLSSLKNYGLSLRFAPDANLTPIFRILSLWFRHFQHAEVNMELDEIVSTVPSYIFIPLSYQILSRLGTSQNNNLQRLVHKMACDHPHHTIIQLLALKKGSKHGTEQYRNNIGALKSEEATKLLDMVKRENQLLLELVQNMEVLSEAYTKLALFDTKAFETRGMKKMPLSHILVGTDKVPFDTCLRLRKFNQTVAARPAMLTYAITPRSDCDYSNVPRVQSFDKEFTIADSGLHRPKIIFCYGSDGIRRKQLVKGNDDTRQDLVIEQAFEIINTFLNDDPNTRSRHLQIKTYKVTPLDPTAGVLEWVDNTMPLGGFLNGKPFDAHARYHPSEWKHQQCRSHIQRSADKLKAYLEIQKNFTPVFHHFFLEKYPDPATWYTRRLAYTRSVAVTSIVGHILGIGDRHSQNILIDEASGELVHIDFGVVFDQGMTLTTPETVPFRLTRDMVDGMGVSGVDGDFTRCCEETLHLLRKRGNALTTIVEVFIHDPLYNWTLSPGKALRVQHDENEDMPIAANNSEDENVADLAARVLLRVKQKLQGYEDPTGEAMSVEGQVKYLIQMAQDPHNLCKIYPGWGPWL